MPRELSEADFRQWTKAGGPAAFVVRERLLPAEGLEAAVFPPTYAPPSKGAEVDYLIDSVEVTDSGGERRMIKVVALDSVGAQANRMEPVFRDRPDLVPKLIVAIGEGNDKRDVSVLEMGHRGADALLRSTEAWSDLREAFRAQLPPRPDARPLAKIAPTSLVFGAWDSRETSAKLPRLVASVIRAWDVSPLRRAAQYVAAADQEVLPLLGMDTGKAADRKKLSEKGFLDAPAGRAPGGVVVHGEIRREASLNLAALRLLQAGGDDTEPLRAYLLGLALVALTAPLQGEGFLRVGCHLVPDPQRPRETELVGADGAREAVALDAEAADRFASKAAETFGVGEGRTVLFDPRLARKLLDQKEPEAE